MADADVDEKWEQYPETVLEFYARPLARVDLRRPLDSRARATLARLGLDAPFAVIAAENPCGENAEDEQSEAEARREDARNQHRTAALTEQLARRGVPFVRVEGVSPDRNDRKRGVTVVMAQRDAVALAGDLAQLALFSFDGDRFWLMPADAEKEPRPPPAPRWTRTLPS